MPQTPLDVLAPYFFSGTAEGEKRILKEVFIPPGQMAEVLNLPPDQKQILEMAAWLHDAVYDPRALGDANERDSAEFAAQLAKRTALAEGIHEVKAKPVLHGDNGGTFKATTVLAMLHWLGVKPSYSRPRVSDDNPFVESLFRTAKYRPEFPARGFADLEDARQWAAHFVHWYNHEHRHSGIRYVSPAQRHAGDDRDILAMRDAVYQQARDRHPRRWARRARRPR